MKEARGVRVRRQGLNNPPTPVVGFAEIEFSHRLGIHGFNTVSAVSGIRRAAGSDSHRRVFEKLTPKPRLSTVCSRCSQILAFGLRLQLLDFLAKSFDAPSQGLGLGLQIS